MSVLFSAFGLSPQPIEKDKEESGCPSFVVGQSLVQFRKEYLASVSTEVHLLLKAQTLTNRLRFDDLTRGLLQLGLRPLACPCCLRLFSASAVKQVQSHIVSSFYLRELQVALMLKYALAMMPTRAHTMSVELLCRDCDHAMGTWENDIKRGTIEFEALLELARTGSCPILYDNEGDTYLFRHGPLFRFILPNVFRLLVTLPNETPISGTVARVLDCLRSYLRAKCVHRAAPRHAHHVDRKVVAPRLFAIPLDAAALRHYARHHGANGSLLNSFPVCFPPFVVTNSSEIWQANYVVVYLDPFALVVTSGESIAPLARWEVLHSNNSIGPLGNSFAMTEEESVSVSALLNVIHLQQVSMVERERLYHPVVLSQIGTSRELSSTRRCE